MSLRRLGIITLLVALLLASAPSSLAASSGEIQVQAIEATSGGVTQGALRALFIEQDTPNERVPLPRFELESDAAVVTRHHAPIWADGADVMPESEILHDGPIKARGVDTRQGVQFWLSPLGVESPIVHVAHQACTALQAPEDEVKIRDPLVDRSRSSLEVDTAGTTVLASCAQSILTVKGDFALTLWEWDFTLNGAVVQTGVQDATEGTELAASGIGTADEINMDVYNGTLTIPLTPETYELYVAQAQLEARDLRFHEATGSLPGILEPVEGENVTLAGDLQVSVRSVSGGQSISVAISGTPTDAHANGAPLTVQVPEMPGSNASLYTTLSIVAGLLILFGIARFSRPMLLVPYHEDSHITVTPGMRGRMSKGLCIMAEADLKKQNLRRARSRARRAVRADRSNPWATYLLAGALLRLAEFGPAKTAFVESQALAKKPEMKARVAMGQAELLALTGDSKGACDALLRARNLHPTAAADSAKARLWDRFEFQGIVALVRSGIRVGGDVDYHQ